MSFSVLSQRAHPRSRGEHAWASCLWRWGRGSSPLTRGARDLAQKSDSERGLIPAHAGSTYQPTGFVSTMRAHPRSRGEHNRSRVEFQAREGSSPLTRGARGLGEKGKQETGLIPAHAGSTTGPSVRLIQSGAHPRSRGEHPVMPWVRAVYRGSSPLTRGARSSRPWRASSPRLIPAHAGSTNSL